MDHDSDLYLALLLFVLASGAGILLGTIAVIWLWRRPPQPNNAPFWRDDFPVGMAWSAGILVSTILFNIFIEGIPRIRWHFQLTVAALIVAFWTFVLVGGGFGTVLLRLRYRAVQRSDMKRQKQRMQK